MGSGNGFNVLAWLLWLGPLVAGLVLAFAKPPQAIAFVHRASGWWDSQYLAAKAKGGLFVGFLWRWLIWGFHKLHNWTLGISDDAVRAAVRATLFFYIAGLSLFLMASAIYLALVVAAIIVGFWLFGKFMQAGGLANENPGSRSSTADTGFTPGKSRERKDFWGKDYTEHVNEDGDVVATSREKKDFWGNGYSEQRSPDGEVLRTSRETEDWLGDPFTEHRDAEGNRAGTSRDKKDWLGDDYVEHRDAEGEEVGRTVDREDWLGGAYKEDKKKD